MRGLASDAIVPAQLKLVYFGRIKAPAGSEQRELVHI